MTEAETVRKDDDLIRKYLPDREDADELAANSMFTRRELVAYLLAERADMTWEEAADEMGISYGTYSGKMGNNVKSKKDKARATVELINLIENGE